MTVEIPLKRKYTEPKRTGKYHSSFLGHSAKKKLRRLLTAREKALHEAQPVKVMYLLANGKRRMRIATKGQRS
jgi:hypothetical protein